MKIFQPIRKLTLFNENQTCILAQGQEVSPGMEDDGELLNEDVVEEQLSRKKDEVEEWYPTTRQYFQFFNPHPDSNAEDSSPVLPIRTTSFGCGKMGYQIWTSSIVLSLLLSSPCYRHKIQGRRVLELGAGCGLPSVVCRDVLGAASVVATDFWKDSPLDATNNEMPNASWGSGGNGVGDPPGERLLVP